jgi:hypothetical protein
MNRCEESCQEEDVIHAETKEMYRVARCAPMGISYVLIVFTEGFSIRQDLCVLFARCPCDDTE